jgi:translation initiation factor IF-3
MLNITQEQTIKPVALTPSKDKDGKDSLRVNEQITARSVRLVDQNAETAGLDLVEISPQAEPPVCKILDYGKYRFEQQKRKNEAKKNQKIVLIKEIKLSPQIGENDYLVKLKAAQKFIAEGDKIKVSMRFKGREVTHSEIGMGVMNRFMHDLDEVAKPEVAPRLDGTNALMILAPGLAAK